VLLLKNNITKLEQGSLINKIKLLLIFQTKTTLSIKYILCRDWWWCECSCI